MSTPQQGDPSTTAFDLFDRWMTNREVPAKDEEPTATPVGEVVIADTKASREAARALMEEAARLEREGLSNDVAPVEPVPAPAPAFEMPAYRPPTVPAPEPVSVEPTPVLVVEATPAPVAAAPIEHVVEHVVEPVVAAPPVTVEAAVFDLPAYRPVTPAVEEPTQLTVVPDRPPVAAVASSADILDLISYRAPSAPVKPVALAPVAVEPVAVEPVAVEPAAVEPVALAPVAEAPVEVPAPVSGGKRRAPVEPDSAPVAVALESEGRRRRHAAPVEVDDQSAVQVPTVEAVAAPAVAEPAPVIAEPAPVVVEPVAVETPAPASSTTNWQEKLAQLATEQPAEPTYDDQAGWADPADEDVAEEADQPADEWDPLTSPLRPGDLEDQPEQSYNLRLIVNVVMLIALLGAGTAGYFLFRGEHWALRPTAALTALGTVITAARFTL